MPSTSDATAVISCRDVYKAFPEGVALAGATCDFPRGAVSVLLGPSGAGKTTLMRLVLGVLAPDRGEVMVDGRRVSAMDHLELAEMRRRFGVLQEGPGALFSSMNVFDNVAFPLRHDVAHAGADVRAIVAARLDEVGLGNDADKMPHELSVGMRVRAALARALALDPHTLVCDSLEYGMDPIWSAQLYGLIRQKHSGSLESVLLITHDVDGAIAIADHAVLLHQGRVVEEGPPGQLETSLDVFTAPFLSGATEGAHMEGMLGEEPDLEAHQRHLDATRRSWRNRAVLVLLISALLVAGLFVIDFPSWPTGR